MANDEAAVERHLDAEVRKLGGLTRKVEYIGRRGCPDRLVAMHGKLYLVELKKWGGKLSAHQIEEHRLLAERGVIVAVLWDKEAVDGWLRSLR